MAGGALQQLPAVVGPTGAEAAMFTWFELARLEAFVVMSGRAQAASEERSAISTELVELQEVKQQKVT